MNNTITNEEFIVVSVPLIWVRTYHKLLELLSCYAEKKIHNPNCKCSGTSSIVLECYDLFQSAIANYKIGKITEANNIIEYIEKTIEPYDVATTFTIEINGKNYYVTPDNIELIPNSSIKSFYGVASFESLNNWDNPQKYIDDNIENILINSMDYNEGEYGVIPFNIDVTNGFKIFLIIVKKDSNIVVTRDNGFGEKIPFSGSFWRANGDVEITIAGEKYLVYGQTYTTSGNIKIYIN